MTISEAEHKALVFTPVGRDAVVACELLKQANVASVPCRNLEAFCDLLTDETWFGVMAEEALRAQHLFRLTKWVESQPPWSDFPFIILTQRGGGPKSNPYAARLSEAFGNVIFIERPFQAFTFLSVAKTAVRGRQRQFEARRSIDDLYESREMLQTALSAGRLGSWVIDVSEKLEASEHCKMVFGRPKAPFAYSDLLESIHPEDKSKVLESISTALGVGTEFSVECRSIWPDGSIHWLQLAARRVQNNDGSKARLVGISSDITDRKSAESRLQYINETLENRVKERTAELELAHRSVVAEMSQRQRAEDQLRQAQKMEAMGQITGGVAHDFNNLLMAVMGNLQLLKKRIPNDARVFRLLEGAIQGAQRGAALTQRLLAFARRQDLKVEPVNLLELVSGVTDLLEHSVGTKVRIEYKLPPAVPLALLDKNQVELAILNLVVNARDAMPEGGTITIKIDQPAAGQMSDMKGRSYVRLIVSDTGHGMDAETLRKATDPFFSTKQLGKGTGLGLSMIHGLSHQLNGALRLKSQPGVGTTAELWLPTTEKENVAVSMAKIDKSAVEAPVPGATILVVDDDALVSMSTAAMLEDMGHEVIEADSAAGALSLLRQSEHIDLLITDYAMPEMTGVQLADAVRKVRPGLPILLATGYAELPPGEKINLPRLAKPYEQTQLAAQISKLLR